MALWHWYPGARNAESEIDIMAGNLPVPQGAEVKLVWTKGGTTYALNILHFAHDVGAIMTQAKANAIDALFKAAFVSSLHNGNVSTTMALARVDTRHMDSNTDPWYVGVGAPSAGTNLTDQLPDATAFCVTLKTGLRGRSFNGRVYLWGYCGSNNSAGGIATPDAVTNSLSFITTISANMAGAQQLDLGILTRWSTPAGAAPGTPPTERTPPIITPVTSVIAMDNRWDVQRRRAIPGI